jgi:hypothetical protein
MFFRSAQRIRRRSMRSWGISKPAFGSCSSNCSQSSLPAAMSRPRIVLSEIRRNLLDRLAFRWEAEAIKNGWQ